MFDKNKSGYIDLKEFSEGMITLFSESFDNLAVFIFNFYDFDKDGFISKEDVRIVLSYIPLKTKYSSKKKLKFENEEFDDRVQSQDELHDMLDVCFKSTETLDQKQFISVVKNVNSDLFLFILIFLLEKKPFSNSSLNEFKADKKKRGSHLGDSLQGASKRTLIASPNLTSKFAPSVTISKSPAMSKRTNLNIESDNKNKSLLNMLAGKPTVQPVSKNETDTNKNIPIARKLRNNLKEIEDIKKDAGYADKSDKDFPIMPAVKLDLTKEDMYIYIYLLIQ